MARVRSGMWLLAGAMFCWLASWGAWGPVTAQGTVPPTATPTATPTPTGTQQPAASVFLPLLLGSQPTPTPTETATATLTPTVTRTYDSIPVAGGGLDHPAAVHPDVNLAVRGYTATLAYLGLINYGGDTDANAPQLAAMFAPPRLPGLPGAFQVYDWDWGCNPPTGCRGSPITQPYNVTLLALTTTPGEEIRIPSRVPDIYQGRYRAMVLYAEPERITLAYTRADSPAVGYLVHIENVAVAPELVALYQQLDAAGRRQLPGLRNEEPLGVAAGDVLKVAVRDTGAFMDPRSCKDWWMDYMGECRMRLPHPRY